MGLATAIEHTLLSADATPAQIERLCDEAVEHGFHGVCVNPLFVGVARRRLGNTPIAVVSVAGFPLGATTRSVKATEARAALDAGATEVDMVVAVGLAAAGEYAGVAEDVRAVRAATSGAVLKVILETGYFSPSVIAELARLCAAEGADFVKTSTGFGPRGATVEDVALLRRSVPESVRIKASGGIRTREQAVALIDAGASRIGTSRGVDLVRADARGG